MNGMNGYNTDNFNTGVSLWVKSIFLVNYEWCKN